MRVVLTETAWADMLNIGLAIKEHNASRAESFVDELYDRCKQLGDMPFAYPSCPITKQQASAAGFTATI